MSCTKGDTLAFIDSHKLHVSPVGARSINGLVTIREYSALYLFKSLGGMMTANLSPHLCNCTCLEIRLKPLIKSFRHSFSISSSNTFLKIPTVPNKVVFSNSAMLTLMPNSFHLSQNSIVIIIVILPFLLGNLNCTHCELSCAHCHEHASCPVETTH